MDLSDRIRNIIKESGLNQKEFAKKINVTDSYISKLLRGYSGMSNTTAFLIEELYGYSKDWILHGLEPKMSRKNTSRELTPLKRKIITDIEQMTQEELKAVYTYIITLRQTNEEFAKKEVEPEQGEVSKPNIE
ncbi:MAG: helix-turn-helix domain-containing protein [Treponema sp.]|jgi:transcriptional regulator with XRE-family HTH domain|nr:helix-turn-helix domain-containing protein [Treponema sp.]